MDKNNIEMIMALLERSDSIAIFWHENPDWDCIWSMLGLWWLLEKKWKKVSYFTPNPISKIFSFLSGLEKIKSDFDFWIYDVLVFVDFSGYRRMGSITIWNEKYFDENKIIVIDHHLWNEVPEHALVYKDSSVMSNCELIFEITHDKRSEFYDEKIATYLYMWLLTDSGIFRFDRWIKQTKRLFSNSIKLLEFWVDKSELIKNIFRKKSFESVEFMQVLFGRMKHKGKVLYTYFDKGELEDKGIDEEESTYAQFIMQEIWGPKIVVVFKVFPWYIKWSIRTNDMSTNCEKVAAYFGGWWHEAAAGFRVECDDDYLSKIDSVVWEIQNII